MSVHEYRFIEGSTRGMWIKWELFAEQISKLESEGWELVVLTPKTHGNDPHQAWLRRKKS